MDYIHGEDVVRELAARENATGFLLPAMEKSQLFPTVVYDGALPRKTFSMGEANEKSLLHGVPPDRKMSAAHPG